MYIVMSLHRWSEATAGGYEIQVKPGMGVGFLLVFADKNEAEKCAAGLDAAVTEIRYAKIIENSSEAVN